MRSTELSFGGAKTHKRGHSSFQSSFHRREVGGDGTRKWCPSLSKCATSKSVSEDAGEPSSLTLRVSVSRGQLCCVEPREKFHWGAEMIEDRPGDSDNLARDHRRLQSNYAEIASLAGGLAHEIRNPLSTIGLNLELLSEDLVEGDSPRERRILQKLSVVKQQCQHLDRILSDFLQFARVGSLVPRKSDLNATVHEFIEFFTPQAAERGIDISPHLAANLPAVQLDAQLWRQVLMNLSRNALQAMPNGGVLELQTYGRDSSVMLDIIDNGQGMSAETQARMFDTFFSTKPDGSGLGLPTVRKIVEAHGGTILCESEIGRGTRFSIVLPGA